MDLDLPRRDPGEEHAEIAEWPALQRPSDGSPSFKEGVGRIPAGPARGWRAREKKAKSCEHCEGDLWVEAADGSQQPCECRRRRADKRTRGRMLAGNWWRGTSLSFAAPPLAQVEPDVANEIHRLCDAIGQGQGTAGLWIFGGVEQNKSAICAYLAQRLLPANKVAAEHLGDLLAHLRWLGAVKGEGAVEAKLQALVDVPLLVIDDLDRPIRTFAGGNPLTLRGSASSRDLIRLASLLDDRISSLRPTVVTSRVEPRNCAERTCSITRPDLVRALLASQLGLSDPIEDFPTYTLTMVSKVFDQLQEACRPCQLSSVGRLGKAA